MLAASSRVTSWRPFGSGIGSSKRRCHQMFSGQGRINHPLSGIGQARYGNLRASGLRFPIEIRADIGTFPAASLADKSRLQIGQPDVIRPSIAAGCYRMATLIVRAIDQEATDAGGPHLPE